MRTITISYHLLIPVLLSIACLVYSLYNRSKIMTKRTKSYHTALCCFFFSYALLVGWCLYLDLLYQSNLNQFDLNNDGFFSGAEINDAEKKAMEDLIKDTGRNFSFLVGLVYSFVLSAIVYGVARLFSYLKKSQAT